jgi:hypothetical protein
MLSSDFRARLAAQQEDLVRTLLGQTERAPAGFDANRLEATTRALASKRARAVAQAWPSLARALADSFTQHFAVYAKATPLPSHGGPRADGRAFAAFLAAGRRLPDVGRLEALAVDLHWRRCRTGLVPRGRLALALAVLKESGRLVVAVRLPGLGTRHFSVPFRYQRGS